MGFSAGVPAFPAFVGNARRSALRGLPPTTASRRGWASRSETCHHLSRRGAHRPTSGRGLLRRHCPLAIGDEGAFRGSHQALPANKATRLETARQHSNTALRDGRLGPARAKLRTHQDLHLAQVLISRGGFKILDFEGEPLRKAWKGSRSSRTERTWRRAGRFRCSGRGLKELETAQKKTERRRARAWEEATSTSFIEGYLSSCPRAVRKRGKKRLLAAVKVWMAGRPFMR